MEVLVALLVLSIGLLGVSKLIMFASRANDSAYQRSQATALAYTMLDAMRANRQAAFGKSYDVSFGAYKYSGGSCDSATSNCSGTTLAQYELSQWKSRLQVALGPYGDGQVVTASVTDTTTGASGVTATVRVRWNDAPAQRSFAPTSATTFGVVTLESVL